MKNLDYVIKKTASDLGLPENKVRIVLKEYWKAGLQNVIKFNGRTTSFRYIGNFTVSKYKLDRYIIKLIRKIRNTKKTKKLSEENRAAALEVYYRDLRMALEQRNEIAISYKKFMNEHPKGLSKHSKSRNKKQR